MKIIRSILVGILILGVGFGAFRFFRSHQKPTNSSASKQSNQSPFRWGIYINAAQLNDGDDPFDPKKIDTMIGILKQLGVDSVLISLEATYPKSNIPYYDVNDTMIDKLYKANFHIVLGMGDNFEFGPTNRYQNSYAFARMIAQRYKGKIDAYQMFNELSGTVMKPGGHSGFTFDDVIPEKYAEIKELVSGFSDGIRSADPTVKRVVSAHWLGIAVIDQLIKDRVNFEVVAWHWFSDMGNNPLDITLQASRGVPASFDGQHFNLPEHFTKQGKEFWITEANYQGGSFDGHEHDQAVFLKQLAEKAYPSHQITGMFVFKLADGFGSEGNSAFGIYQTKIIPDSTTKDGKTFGFDRPKEAFLVLQKVIKASRQ